MLPVMRRGTNGTTRKGKFLTALAAGSSVAAAASAAGIGRSSASRWRDDPAFADAWDNAEQESVDLLEDAARVRALSPDMPGSTATLLFLLRHRRPERYRPPPASAATVSLAPDDLRAVEGHRRISALTPEELRAEIDEIERKRSLVAEARQELATRRKTANGAVDRAQ